MKQVKPRGFCGARKASVTQQSKVDQGGAEHPPPPKSHFVRLQQLQPTHNTRWLSQNAAGKIISIHVLSFKCQGCTHGKFAYKQVPSCPSWVPNEGSRAPRPSGFQPIRGASPLQLQLLRPDLSPPSAARAGSHNPQEFAVAIGTPNLSTKIGTPKDQKVHQRTLQ